MVLSEAEAEARLAALRREREALDRAIADLTLYLELGRRLTGGAPTPMPMPQASCGPHDTSLHPRPHPEVPARSAGLEAGLQGSREESRGRPEPSFEAAGAAPRDEGTGGKGRAQDDEDVALSETVLARRYGRAVIAAALGVLEAAGRPLHAGEIQAALAARGFALPGSDPVAALNTRLWKRSGPGGPLRRLGEAVYALAEP